MISIEKAPCKLLYIFYLFIHSTCNCDKHVILVIKALTCVLVSGT